MGNSLNNAPQNWFSSAYRGTDTFCGEAEFKHKRILEENILKTCIASSQCTHSVLYEKKNCCSKNGLYQNELTHRIQFLHKKSFCNALLFRTAMSHFGLGRTLMNTYLEDQVTKIQLPSRDSGVVQLHRNELVLCLLSLSTVGCFKDHSQEGSFMCVQVWNSFISPWSLQEKVCFENSLFFFFSALCLLKRYPV